MPATSTKVDACALCEGHLSPVLLLEDTPPANELLLQPTPDNERYPLNLMQCNLCDHLQLDTEISMFRLFKHYVYTANTSSSNYNYFYDYANEMYEKFKPNKVLDIGSNDGLFLHFFAKKGCEAIGVDPAENIVEIANHNDVLTYCAFFNELESTKIKSKHGSFDLITCNNMFAHNRNLNEVLLGVKNLLSDTGTFIFEVSYAAKMLEKGLFDLIYHEHFHHWHLLPAVKYLKKFGLHIYDAQVIEQTHGGSIRVYAKHVADARSCDLQSNRLKELLTDETNHMDKLVRSFSDHVENLKQEMTTLLADLKKQKKQISLLGYPAKACTMSYYFGFDTKTILKVYDNNPLKIGKYTHQGHKIEPFAHIYKDKPDYLILCSWNYKEELVKKHNLFLKTGGHIIIPLPQLEIV